MGKVTALKSVVKPKPKNFEAATALRKAKLRETFETKELDFNINHLAKEQYDKIRQQKLTPDYLKAEYDVQAMSPEEFTGRVPQLTNPDFSTSAIERGHFDLNIPDPRQHGIDTNTKYQTWLMDQKPIEDSVRSNQALMDWGREGAYTRGRVFDPNVANPEDPVIFYRMDIRQDPREGLTPIQFDPDANEFGMHIGSRQAGLGIASPDVAEFNTKRTKQIRDMFSELTMPLAEEGVDPVEIWEQALKETRTNLFLRFGETPFEAPNVELVNRVIDDFFDELAFIADADKIDGLTSLVSSDVFKNRLRQIMRSSLDPHQHPVMTNVKQGLLVPDLGPKNTAAGQAEELIGRGLFDDDVLQSIASSDNASANLRFRELLREGGYDHLVYVNNAEDNGVISIVLFDEANYQNLYKPTINSKGRPTGYQVGVSALLGILGSVSEDTELQ